MGLAERKTKQRFGADPQNKQWRDDKNRFGVKMLEKMGWTEGKGLGSRQHGQTEAIRVKMKQDNLGIGADKVNTSDNWLENSSGFDQLLQSLNSTNSVTFTASADQMTESSLGRLYHRRKFIRNKTVSNYDASHLNEILGKKETQTIECVTQTETKETSVKTTTNEFNTTVSSLSVQDYFAQKMALIKSNSLKRPIDSAPQDTTEDPDVQTIKKKKKKRKHSGSESK